MDWQTKEYIDSQFGDLTDKIDLILNHLNISEDDDMEVEDGTTEQSEGLFGSSSE